VNYERKKKGLFCETSFTVGYS